MAEITFEDLTPGSRYDCGPITLARDELVAFAREYDPQPFHLSEEAAKGTFVGKLIASGWQTCALGMRLFAKDFILRASSMGSPGVEEVRWLRPVEPDDSLAARLEVRARRPSTSKPDRGFVHLLLTLTNGAGETVMTQDFWVMFGRRGAALLPPRAVPEPVDDGLPQTTSGDDAPTPPPFLDDIAVGTRLDLGSFCFDRERVLAFARAYDPQPFHVDEAGARASHFGALCASGWQTAAVWMNRYHAAHARHVAAARAAGLPVPRFGPSPGFKALKWLAPVYVGDRLRFASTVTEVRPSASRPGWGLVFQDNVGVNQRGETVFSFRGCVFWERRAG
jgi:acyl dehydratase